MSPVKMGSRQVKGITAEDLTSKASSLRDALEAGGDQLDRKQTSAGAEIVAKVHARTALRGGHTVVALAGATGSGKSSLFNALVGSSVATVGAKRPTTSKPTAAVWGPESATELLDWLTVGRRHRVEGTDGGAVDGGAPDDAESSPGSPGSLEGLVLLDLPDFDSRIVEHRREADLILALVDVFVWVTDPQKYADARLHDDYLAALSMHDAVTVVVLNQADRLTPQGVSEVTADLVRLGERDGIRGLQVYATSARTGQGLDELRMRLAAAVAGQNAARYRLAADIKSVASHLRSDVADTEPSLREADDTELVDSLCRAAGIPTVVAAVERDYRQEASARTGWPLTRWARSLRPDPIKRLRLSKGDTDDSAALPGVTAADVRGMLGRSSLPPATPAARASVDVATRRLGERAGEGLPTPWAEAVADAATPPGPDLADALDQAVLKTPLRARDPLWWTVFGVAQTVLALLTVVGLGWLVLLGVAGWLRLPEIRTPYVGALPLPTLLLVGGLLLGLVLAAVSRPLARSGARRRAALINERLRSSVATVASAHIVAPVRAVLERHAQTRRSLDAARS
ncbi:MAG TPA: GTPase [Pedococcus sp.]|jgi:predicted GTPase|uniref:GTPase n=1 Tax=Pedococcus sp. TaxID=2860345 RepID=UPI002F956AE3